VMNPATHHVPVNSPMCQRGTSVRAFVPDRQKLAVDIEQSDQLSVDAKHPGLAGRYFFREADRLEFRHEQLLEPVLNLIGIASKLRAS
jgi:hypothetical protein